MRKLEKSEFVMVLMLVSTLTGWGQGVPSVRRAPMDLFHVPSLNGSLRYSLTGSERVQLGYNGGDATSLSSSISGDVGYLSESISRPFSLVYSGGYLGNTSGQASSFFHNLAVSQTVDTKRWEFIGSDTLNYLPNTPSTGLSGLPGLGDVAVGESLDANGTLTKFSTRVSNQASGTVVRKVTANTQVEGTGMYAVQRFLGGSGGLETNQETLSGGVNHRIDSRTSVAGSYQYNNFMYVGYTGTFASQGLSVEYTRQVTRKLRVSVAGGPERVSGSELTGSGPSWNFTANASASYIGERTSASAAYVRMTNNGSGVSFGARTDTLSGNVSRPLTPVLSGAATLGYTNSSSLAVLTGSNLSTRSVVFSGQLNRTLGRNLSGYVSYSAQRQFTQGVDFTGLTLSGLSQTLGFGLTYSPPLLRFAGH